MIVLSLNIVPQDLSPTVKNLPPWENLKAENHQPSPGFKPLLQRPRMDTLEAPQIC